MILKQTTVWWYISFDIWEEAASKAHTLILIVKCC